MKNFPKIHCRHLLLFFFHQSKGKISVFAAMKKICDVYGNDTITEKTCQRWLKKFKEGNFDLEDQQRTGRKRRLSLQDFDSRISKNPKTNTRELTSSLECSLMTVSRGLKKLGMKKKLSQWIPHSLNSAQKEKRVQICNTLLERHKIKCRLSIFTFF